MKYRPTMTVKEAAYELCLSVDSIRSYLRAGTLEGFKRGALWRVKTDSVMDLKLARLTGDL